MKLIAVLPILFLSVSVFAAEKTTTVTTETTTTTVEEPEKPTIGERAKETAGKAKDVVQSSISNAGDRREASKVSLMAEYSPFDLIIPSKIGGAVGYIHSREATTELEYLSASWSVPFFISDIGGFSDRRITFRNRIYAQRNSFNFHYGLSYMEAKIHVGSSYLQSANLNSDLMEQKALGVEIGFGNRWTFPKGWTLGVDYFSWAQPIFTIDQDSSIINSVQDQGAKQKLQDAFQATLYIPRLSILKIAIGYIF